MRSKIYVSTQHMNAYARKAEMKENICLSKHHTHPHKCIHKFELNGFKHMKIVCFGYCFLSASCLFAAVA